MNGFDQVVHWLAMVVAGVGVTVIMGVMAMMAFVKIERWWTQRFACPGCGEMQSRHKFGLCKACRWVIQVKDSRVARIALTKLEAELAQTIFEMRRNG